MTWFVDLIGIVRGATEVGAVAPMVTVLAFDKQLTILDVVVIGTTPCIVEGVVARAVGPGVVKVIVAMVNLVIRHIGKGRYVVDDMGGNT